VRAGYEHVQLVKRYSTCGMGPSQGRHSALATARLVADATGRTVAETGVTTARPPFAPETLAHCAGRSFFPASYSSMHHRHVEAGAQMLQAGAWYRPAYYGAPGDLETCVRREVLQVRRGVGLIDVSTLGGIDVRGPDAAEFLNRIYTFAYKKQATGTVRYALMTNEAGVVIDDGVACRLGEEHFYVTATTGGVERVFRAMLQWNARWRLDVSLANVTSAYCGVNIVGPESRSVLAALVDDLELSAAAFPYLAVREGGIAGIPARILRVGFVGELGYEIHVPQHCGEALWDALVAAGSSAEIRPVGIEAQRMLRLEKGHVIVGQDTDAMSNPLELQMGWAIARKKPYFVGRRSLQVYEQRPLDRLLTGFCVEDDGAPLPKESHLVMDGEQMIGRVTSCALSPTLGKIVGLAYVPPALAEPGSHFTIRCDNRASVSARAVATPFYDPDNQRQEL
jgi:sarcosine oxidase subunit alpha